MMQLNNSNEVISNQQGVHENLEAVVRKHFETEYKKPIAEHTQIEFDNIRARVEKELKNDTPLLFDSFCGTGISTGIIAKNNPNALVIGIDRSITRLSKTYNDELPENAILIQAECADFWLLANQAGWQLSGHSIYYPNPYPKSKHLKRRWHAHPAYPLLFSLGGSIELRTNWKIYADEFQQAFTVVKNHLKNLELTCEGVEMLYLGAPFTEVPYSDAPFTETAESNFTNNIEFMTLFEKKYYLNGQKLYRCLLQAE